LEVMVELTPIPQKMWSMVDGNFDLPEDEEFDAFQAIRSPPVGAGWPFWTCHYTDYHANGERVDHWCLKTQEGKWLEISEVD
jgi:hypothetical protein